MAGSSDLDLGGIARGGTITARAAVNRETTGSWNKWRGPALRGEETVYAAKARRLPIDCEHGVIRCPPFRQSRPPSLHLLRGTAAKKIGTLARTRQRTDGDMNCGNSNHSMLGHGVTAAVTDNEVIEYEYVHEGQQVLQSARDEIIRWARLESAGWIEVRENH